MADAGAVERVAVPPRIKADEVECNGGEDVLQVGLLETEVAGPSLAESFGEPLPDGIGITLDALILRTLVSDADVALDELALEDLAYARGEYVIIPSLDALRASQ